MTPIPVHARAMFVALFALITMLAPTANPAVAAPDPGIPEADRALVEQSGEIFNGTIDIVTEVVGRSADEDEPAFATRYTVLVDEVLKGKLEPQSIVVIQQIGGNGSFTDGDSALEPGADYLLFTSYLPGERVYAITKPVAGNLSLPDADALDAWRNIILETWCAFDDVLIMDGVTYQRRDWNDSQRYLRREWVGASIAEVQVQDTAANACRSDQADLTATSAPQGTKIQILKGYDPAFRVALRLPDNHRYLYEAVRNDSATMGADLLDLRNRVVAIEAERWSECDDGADCGVDARGTSTDDEIETIVDLVLDAPVRRDAIDLYDRIGKYLRIQFVLDDGSTVDVIGSLLTGLTANGIELPIDGIILMLWGG